MKLKKKHHHHHASFSVDENRKTLHQNLDFTATEQYKLLRTNLGFTLPANEKCPIIGVTSSIRGEGKSTTSINLSYVLAEKGSKVLLIDSDLRLPSVAKKMELDQKRGLTDFLMGKGGDINDFRSDLLETWYVLPAGTIPPNPSELLGSSRMQALLEEFRKTFDYIVLDLPPVNLVSDAMSVSGYITGMVVVAREEYIEKKDLKACFRQLELSGVKILGCVMTCAKRKSGSYSKYSKYKRYKYYKYYSHYYGHYGNNNEIPKESGKDVQP